MRKITQAIPGRMGKIQKALFSVATEKALDPLVKMGYPPSVSLSTPQTGFLLSQAGAPGLSYEEAEKAAERMVERGIFKRVFHGVYALTEQYTPTIESAIPDADS